MRNTARIAAVGLLLCVPLTPVSADWSTPRQAPGVGPAVAFGGETSYVAWIDGGALKVSVNGKAAQTAARGVDKGVTPALAGHRSGAGALTGSACLTSAPRIDFTGSRDAGKSWTTTTVASEPCLGLDLKTSRDGSTMLALWEASTDVTDIDSPTVLRSAVSTDGGTTWSAPTTVPLADNSAEPQVAMSSDGSRVVVASSRSLRGDKAVQLTTSTDGGATWSPKRDLVTGRVDLISLSMDTSPDLRHIAMIWTRSDSTVDRNYVVRSHDAGASWSTPKALGKAGDYPDTGIGISDNGKRVVAFWTRNTSAWSQMLVTASSRDGAKTWSSPATAVGSKTGKFSPHFAVSGDGKRMVALWSGALSKAGKQAVVSATSTGGRWRTSVLQRTSGLPLETTLALSESGKKAVAAWRLGRKQPSVYRSLG